MNDNKNARKHLDTAEAILKTNFGETASHLNFLLTKSKYFNATQDFKNSHYYLSQYLNLKDSLANVEKEQNLYNTEMSFKVEQNEAELLEKNKQLENERLEKAKQKTYRAYSIAGIIFLIGLVFFLITTNQLSKKREVELQEKNTQINHQNKQIEQSLKEKELLLKEIHHRVKNNLQIISSMINLQLSKVDDERAKSTLLDVRQRINAIALTHQMLYQNIDLTDIATDIYITRLVEYIKESMPKSDIHLITKIGNVSGKLNIDTAIPFGLLINELLTNAYKHAFPKTDKGNIEVYFNEENGISTLTISDNGVGIADNINFSDKKSLGMELVEILSEQLDATLNINNNKGTTVSLAFPSEKLYLNQK